MLDGRFRNHLDLLDVTEQPDAATHEAQHETDSNITGPPHPSSRSLSGSRVSLSGSDVRSLGQLDWTFLGFFISYMGTISETIFRSLQRHQGHLSQFSDSHLVSWICLGSVLDLSWICPIMSLSWVCPGLSGFRVMVMVEGEASAWSLVEAGFQAGPQVLLRSPFPPP